MGHACLFFQTEDKITDRVAIHTTQVHGYAQACLLFLTKAKIPDRVATRNSGAVHGHAYFFALVPYSMHIGIIKTPNFCQLAMM